MNKITYKPLIKIYPYNTINKYFQLNSYPYNYNEVMLIQKGYFKDGKDIGYQEKTKSIIMRMFL